MKNSFVYGCDQLHSIYADLAMIDAAYGHDDIDQTVCRQKLVWEVRRLLKETNVIFLPVPQYGRGLELLQLLWQEGHLVHFYRDPHLRASSPA